MIQTLFGSVEQEPTLLEKLKSGVQKTRAGLVPRWKRRSRAQEQIDADLLEELEYALITRRHRRARRRKRSSTASAARGTHNWWTMRASCADLIREHLLEILQASERAPLAWRSRPRW